MKAAITFPFFLFFIMYSCHTCSKKPTCRNPSEPNTKRCLSVFCSFPGRVGLGAWWKDTFQPFCLAFLLRLKSAGFLWQPAARCRNQGVTGEGVGGWGGRGGLRVTINCNSCWFLWRRRRYCQALERVRGGRELSSNRISRSLQGENNSCACTFERARSRHQRQQLPRRELKTKQADDAVI